MTYNVFGGTLNLTQSINQSILRVVKIIFKNVKYAREVCVLYCK